MPDCRCRRICEPYQISEPNHFGKYRKGYKRCVTCGWLDTTEFRCPCSGFPLRSHPRGNTKGRIALEKAMGLVRY